MTARSVLSLKHVAKDDLELAGTKAVELGELAQGAIPIPEGFVVTSGAYLQFLKENKLEHKIKALLSTAHFEYLESIIQISTHIKALIMQSPLSGEEIMSSYKKLPKDHHHALVLLHGSVLPGQHSKNLYIHGEENLLTQIKEMWTSVFEPQELFYRHKNNLDHFKTGMAIIVQRMIQTDVSGVMLTSYHHDKSKIVIRTKLGDKPSNHYAVDKSTVAITASYLKTYPSPLKESQVLELARLGKKIEKHCYFPQHVDWALEHNRFYIVHIRTLL